MNREEGKKRAERSDKKVRVSPSLSKLTHDKLDRLAVACGSSKSGMAEYLIELCLNNENILNHTQNDFREHSRFRIIPTKVDGDYKFIYAEKTSIKNNKSDRQ